MSYNPASLPVEIDGTQFLIDTRQYRRTTVPALREQRDTSKEPGENTLDTSGAWTRSQTDGVMVLVKRILIDDLIVVGSALLVALIRGLRPNNFTTQPNRKFLLRTMT